jgi:hypothetical protein
LLEFLQKKLVGPGLGIPDPEHGWECEKIEGRMSLAYMQGMLYPRASMQSSDVGGDEEEGDDADEAGLSSPDDPLGMATALMPASMGITFCLEKGSSTKLEVSGSRYERLDTGASKSEDNDREEGSTTSRRSKKARASEKWVRSPLGSEPITLKAGEAIQKKPVLEGMGSLDVLPRKLPNGSWLMTVSLSNVNEARHSDPAATIYQAQLVLRTIQGGFASYPTAGYAPPTEEERELQVIYGDHKIYAVGHGVSADWRIDGDGVCTEVCTQAIPRAHVWRPVFDRLELKEGGKSFEDLELFRISELASGQAKPVDLGKRLKHFVTFYEEWIGEQEQIDVPGHLEDDAERILSRCRRSAARMHEGAVLLEQNENVYKAFTLANRALLMSMCHHARVRGVGRDDKLQGPFELGQAETDDIDYLANRIPCWRPFQLAFILQILPSLCAGDHSDRDVVDVIWFPTGGGKTEAYLLAAAFELIRRRLEHGERGAGTGVLNRYTYRFLTSDQFQRTAGMICSLELLRRKLGEEGDGSLGETEFSIGLFVGGEVSPNRITSSHDDGAYQRCIKLYESSNPREENPFPIESCPSCGTLLVPPVEMRLPGGEPDTAYFGFIGSESNFLVRCPEESCAFHQRIPAYLVDEQILASPPSFLLGTIDKFAMVPWRENGGRLFGIGTGNDAPSLVIQDELHLISGPLGTLAGLYEAAFETLMRVASGVPPKYIAATATIRNAGTQCRRIYGREGVVFPSPGLNANDSFFACLDVGNVDRSRFYIGLMGQGLRSTVAVSWAMAAILQSVKELDDVGKLTEDELDAFWTLVAYHNSKRELGRISNATRDEIPSRLKVYSPAEDMERDTNFHVLELKAHAETPIPVARQVLSKRHSQEDPSVDIVPCTNIISVGVDIDRLGLMLVNGQPKLTAEYIQASSRVGRGKVPGLVVTCFSPSKPRDRSHYESFRAFHERFYSYVEPTSVTPGSIPAIERALHAALVTVVRHGAGLRRNEAASRFDPTNETVKDVIDLLADRLEAAYDAPEERAVRARLLRRLEDRIKDWQSWANQHSDLRYNLSRKQQGHSLLTPFGDDLSDGVGWNTLQSMRHVDSEIILKA